jgi:hypothetical protein
MAPEEDRRRRNWRFLPVAGDEVEFEGDMMRASRIDCLHHGVENDEAHPPVPSERRGVAGVTGDRKQRRRCSR